MLRTWSMKLRCGFVWQHLQISIMLHLYLLYTCNLLSIFLATCHFLMKAPGIQGLILSCYVDMFTCKILSRFKNTPICIYITKYALWLHFSWPLIINKVSDMMLWVFRERLSHIVLFLHICNPPNKCVICMYFYA